MTAAKLRLLRVLGLELFTDAVEQLNVALLRVLLEGGDESPGHGSGGLASDVCVLPMRERSSAYGRETAATHSSPGMPRYNDNANVTRRPDAKAKP